MKKETEPVVQDEKPEEFLLGYDESDTIKEEDDEEESAVRHIEKEPSLHQKSTSVE